MNYQEVFTKLRETNSRKEKINILLQADEYTKKILVHAYDPFKHYHINKIPKFNTSTAGRSLESIDIDSLFKELSDRTLSGGEARATIEDILWDLNSTKDAELLGQILRKDLRCGISAKTINAAHPGLIPEFGVTLAKKWTDDRFKKGLLMSLKLDGLRAVFDKGKFYSRNGYEIKGLEHLENVIPKVHSFDGELMVPGEHFQDASGLLRSDNPTPDAMYNVFDIPASTLPFTDRYKNYEKFCDQINSDFVVPVKHIPVQSLEHLHRTFDKAIAAGYEGLVIKTAQHFYERKRSWNWMKVKVENSEDLPVIAKFEGTGKYEGQLGGLIVSRDNGVEVRVGSGFSDAERINIWDDFESFVGKTIEVAYHEETPDGSLRHPVYKGFRWDKDK